VLAVLRFVVAEPGAFVAAAHDALAALAGRPGYIGGQLCRAYDDPAQWCLVTEWESVGSYRRALSAYDVKVRATQLLAQAIGEPSAFEPLATAAPGDRVHVADSDLTDGSVQDRGGSLRSRP
jgi:hypothetical protein